MGSNELVLAAGAEDVNELPDSSSLSSSERDLDGATSETLRREQKCCGRAVRTKARGSDLARYLDDSEVAIGGLGSCRCN